MTRRPLLCENCSSSTWNANVWCSRSVTSRDRIVLTASTDELDELIGFVAAEANHENNRRRQKRLDAASDVLSEALKNVESGHSSSTVVAIGGQAGDGRRHPRGPTGRWRILEMDLWDHEALDLVEPAFIEFVAITRVPWGSLLSAAGLTGVAPQGVAPESNSVGRAPTMEIRSAVEDGLIFKTMASSVGTSTSTSAMIPVSLPNATESDSRGDLA